MKPLMKYHVVIETPDGRRVKTWGIFPILNSTKILDGVYNPEAKELSLLMDSVTEQYTPFEVPTKNGKYEVQQRKIDQYYRFKLREEDLEFFLSNYVDNNFEIEPVVESQPKIVLEPELV
jgi:hypothetical protein